jgi:transposase
MTSRETALTAMVTQARLAAIRARSDDPAAALDLADEFAAVIRNRSQTTLSDWLGKGNAASPLELRRFAGRIRRDEAALLAAVMQRWSNGPVEGQLTDSRRSNARYTAEGDSCC